jgi:tripartite-type tricarboxylate transporter receptor subunit TctC
MPSTPRSTAASPTTSAATSRRSAAYGSQPLVIVVRNDLPARDVAEFLALARRTEITAASPGNGTSGHLAAAMLNVMAGTKLTHVPYRGESFANTDLVAQRVDCMFAQPTTALPNAQGGLRQAEHLLGDEAGSARG